MMRVLAKSLTGSLLLEGALHGYPKGHPVDGGEHIPWLNFVSDRMVPERLCAFNDRGRATDPKSTGLHFFRGDETFLPVLASPLNYLQAFAPYKLLLTPDITVGDGMPPWQRARAVALSRMVGVSWQAHGLVVVPTLRWRTKDDYANVSAGIHEGSVVAVSNYGSRRDPELAYEFGQGLNWMVERLAPAVVLVYGSLKASVFAQLRSRTEFVEYVPPMTAYHAAQQRPETAGQMVLFNE